MSTFVDSNVGIFHTNVDWSWRITAWLYALYQWSEGVLAAVFVTDTGKFLWKDQISMKGNRTTVCTTPGKSGTTLTIGDSPFRTLMVHSSLPFIECLSSCPCHVHRKLRSQVFIVYYESQDFAFKNFAVFSLFVFLIVQLKLQHTLSSKQSIFQDSMTFQ